MGQKIDLTQQVQGVLPEINGGAGPLSGTRFSDAETPAGTIDGNNKSFTLQYVPNPTASLLLFMNKTLQIQGTDYTLSGNSLTMGTAPPGGATFLAWYRYQSQSLKIPLLDSMATFNDSFVFDVPASVLLTSASDVMATMMDQMAKIMAPGLYEDKMVMVDAVKTFGTGTVLVTEQLSLSDNLRYAFGILEQLSDQLTLSDAYTGVTALPQTLSIGDFPDFTDSMISSLSGNWVQQVGVISADGSGAKFVSSGQTFAVMSYGSTEYQTQQHAQVVVNVFETGHTIYLGPMVNVQNNATGEGYLLWVFGDNYFISRITGGNANISGPVSASALQLGDTLRIENDGAGNLTGFRNGVAIIGPVKDTTYLHGMPGVGAYSSAAASRVKSFDGGPGTTAMFLTDAFQKFLQAPGGGALECGDSLSLKDAASVVKS
jgi:hypothetical protein